MFEGHAYKMWRAVGQFDLDANCIYDCDQNQKVMDGFTLFFAR